ncbi:stage II sporulation protein M [Thermolongibacillus altinsuensis]|jgi:stage II sporulation protein M|uniref:Stage II sporulation protein M n=1 Tax=Thermolongibacillus altinsuensis TaxID=575256 RepID=A0A4R1QHX8_9BACL|nr:stage II sporulation protein M [Thermolongibacillus altinsuensis]TCL53066.1 stage II sporulation protein M [Thermolongibacillus altinsuensis]GMB07768.1 stage II sporulation protein M [Thermolongibacillus altinsuensis]
MRKRSLATIWRQHVQEHYSIYVFTVVLFLMGVIFGAIVVNSLNFSQKEDLYYYLTSFFGQVSEGNLASSHDLLKESFFQNIKYIGLMWILAMSLVGLPLILILLFLKGMVVGFTVGFLVNQMGWNGFLLAFVSVVPQNLVLVPVFMVMAAISIAFSLKMIRHQFIKRTHEPIFRAMMRYTVTMFAFSLTLLVASSLEAYVSPFLMKEVIQMIEK